MPYFTHKKAFSMLELIFVIVILGIVASIGSSLIVKVYESYIVQRAVHRASLKTELAVNFLANRLAYRIDTSVLAHRPNGFAAADMLPLQALPLANANIHRALEWIGYENDGFSTQGSQATPAITPAWTGFVDLDDINTNFNGFTSTGSNLGNETTILRNLFPNMTNPAMIFLSRNYHNTPLSPYTAECLHQIGAAGCIFPLNFPLAGNHFRFTGDGDRVATTMRYTEFYQLAASAYAVVPENPLNAIGRLTPNGTRVWDLFFYSDYQPWTVPAERYNVGVKSLLLPNVSVFRFTQERNSLRIKICSIESIEGTDISICKEKAVIR